MSAVSIHPSVDNGLAPGSATFAGGTLMSQRLDFPRPGLARIGWVALPRVAR